MSLVHQNLLDKTPRLARFSVAARRILISQLIEVVSPNFFPLDAPELADPGLDESWEELE